MERGRATATTTQNRFESETQRKMAREMEMGMETLIAAGRRKRSSAAEDAPEPTQGPTGFRACSNLKKSLAVVDMWHGFPTLLGKRHDS